MNAEVVVATLLDSGWAARATLARWTGLSKPSVAEVVDQLVGAGVLLQRETSARTKEYSVDSSRSLGAAVSISVEAVEVVIVDASGTVRGSHRVAHSQRDSALGIVDRIILTVLQTADLDQVPVRDVVIGVAASFDSRTNQLRHADSLPTWTADELSRFIAASDASSRTTVIENDVKLALLSERAARPLETGTMSLIWLGHGDGLASWVNGGVLQGASGGAGEISYLRTDQKPLSALIGSDALVALAASFGLDGADAVSLVSSAARESLAGDPSAGALLDEIAERLLPSAAAICTIVDPGVIVLGGPIGEAGGLPLVRRVSAGLPRLTPLPCVIEASAARGDSVLHGATLLAGQRTRDRLMRSVGHVEPAASDRIGA